MVCGDDGKGKREKKQELERDAIALYTGKAQKERGDMEVKKRSGGNERKERQREQKSRRKSETGVGRVVQNGRHWRVVVKERRQRQVVLHDCHSDTLKHDPLCELLSWRLETVPRLVLNWASQVRQGQCM